MDSKWIDLDINRQRDAVQSDNLQPVYFVGIGASAGGLNALEALFDRLPADTGMAFVVVQHLSPDFKSLMDEIIRKHTEMAVFSVTDGITVCRNAIYLMPAGKEMVLSKGCLRLRDRAPHESLTLPIDDFFRSLARECETRAIAIVLSGSGSDGSRGVRDIHASGGLVIAQDSTTAEFNSMPVSTRDTGVVDIVGRPDQIANSLLRLVQHPLRRASSESDRPLIPEDGIRRILEAIHESYGIDFRHYKPSTVMRRIERRLLLSHSDKPGEYIHRVIHDPDELSLFYKDLLIGVTRFFRDPEAFKTLETRILPELFLKLSPQQEVRIWVAGCATGEEAYSIAILIHEQIVALNRPTNVRIFATDVHRASLDAASVGVYGESSIIGVSPVRLERYFTEVRNGYKISPDLRNMVVFAPHNLIDDAPFTRLDLITCRNMMIYLQPQAQKKVLSLFHLALHPGGVLFLGPSETTGELADEFEVIDAKWRLCRKRRDIRLPSEMRLPVGGRPMSGQLGGGPSGSTAKSPIRASSAPIASSDRELLGVYDTLLSDYMPTAFLMNQAFELVHSFGDLSDILRVPQGRASANVLDMLPTDLRTIVIGAIQQVTSTGNPVSYDQVRVSSGQNSTLYRVTVKRIMRPTLDSVYTFISLQQLKESEAESETANTTTLEIDRVSRERINTLEGELRHSRESLQATIEALESSNDQLQVTNEAMVASNEELQSTNEELHSINQELNTVNAEYQKKIGELTELGHDMSNLLNSTDVHILFLDENLAVRKFTPQMAQVFQLTSSDVGRRIEEISHSVPSEDLMGKLADVLAHGKRWDEEIRMPNGEYFLMRILPYRGEIHRMGVVLTLLDITSYKDAETRFRATFDNAAVGIAHVELEGRFLRVNDRLCEILGYDRNEILHKTFADVTYAGDLDLDRQQFAALKRGEIDRLTIEKRFIRKEGGLVWISLTISLQRDESGEPQYAISVVQDISKRKTFEAGLTEAVRQRDRFLATLSHELRNPLAAVRHSLKLYQHERVTQETKVAAIRTVERQTLQMAQLLDDLLDVSRITEGKVSYEMCPLDLRKVVGDAVDALAPSIDQHQHKLAVELPDQPVIVKGDESRLLQVVENLLTNSCKYTPSGGKIEVALSQGDGRCRLAVSDNGRGIAAGLLGSVFDMFVQSDYELARREGGMGLGLTVVKSLVEYHQGTIEVASAGLGRGARFTVVLPLSDMTPESLDHVPSGSLEATSSRKPIPVVLVEDNEDARTMLESLLDLEGFQVTSCADGQAGLETLLRLMPPVALVDIGLPEMDGYEVARQFRARCPNADVHLIALTGYGQASDIRRSQQSGFDSHLTKPVNPDELIAFLNQMRAGTVPVDG